MTSVTNLSTPKSFCSKNGRDCCVQGPNPFNALWYSHKFHIAALRYELCVGHKCGNIVWVYGPFPCGSWPDTKVYKSRLMSKLTKHDLVVADRGYNHTTCTAPNNIASSHRHIRSQIRARHEVCSQRLKRFNILAHKFRHNIHLHGSVFHACAKITFIAIRDEEPLFEL